MRKRWMMGLWVVAGCALEPAAEVEPADDALVIWDEDALDDAPLAPQRSDSMWPSPPRIGSSASHCR